MWKAKEYGSRGCDLLAFRLGLSLSSSRRSRSSSLRYSSSDGKGHHPTQANFCPGEVRAVPPTSAPQGPWKRRASPHQGQKGRLRHTVTPLALHVWVLGFSDPTQKASAGRQEPGLRAPRASTSCSFSFGGRSRSCVDVHSDIHSLFLPSRPLHMLSWSPPEAERSRSRGVQLPPVGSSASVHQRAGSPHRDNLLWNQALPFVGLGQPYDRAMAHEISLKPP